jgi:hypothetical protein
MFTMLSYSYSSLSEATSIRLLRLLPHEDEAATIECQLFEFSLHTSDRGSYLYDALSYVWGGSAKPNMIRVNGHELMVTTNLHTALKHLRDRYFERVLWIDAICINQDSLLERGQQVKSMARIYGKANKVIVWLGEAADGSNQAMEELREVAGEELKKTPRNDSIDQAILAILKRPWFRRIWVSKMSPRQVVCPNMN